MPKVFVLNKGAHDFTAARRYGELVYCTDGSLDKWNVHQMYRELSAAMADSSPEDFILLTSLSVLCTVAGAMFASKHQRLNLLIFKDGDYIQRTLLLPTDK